VSEILRTYIHRGEVPALSFWRSSTGTEVDLLIDTGRTLVPIEVKLSATPRPAMAETILRLRKDLGSRVGPGYIVHPGDLSLPLAPGVTALPFRSL
jgi:predicted AAA+ superfamily ATPase